MFSTNFLMKSVSFNKYQHCQYYVKVQGVSEWVKVAQSCPTLCDPMDYVVHGILQARILEWVAFPFSNISSQPRDRTQVSTLQVDSLPAEPQRKPRNTRVGSLSLLQRIFPTQKSNQGLLYCTRILYQLSYEGSPYKSKEITLNLQTVFSFSSSRFTILLLFLIIYFLIEV